AAAAVPAARRTTVLVGQLANARIERGDLGTHGVAPGDEAGQAALPPLELAAEHVGRDARQPRRRRALQLGALALVADPRAPVVRATRVVVGGRALESDGRAGSAHG